MFFPVIRNGFVKGGIFVLSYIIRFAHPKGLRAVQVIPFMSYFLNFFGFLLAFCLFFFNVLYFWLIFILLFVCYLFFSSFLSVEFDRESNEFRVLLHEVS